VLQRSRILLPTTKFVAEVDINDIPSFYLTDNFYWLYPLSVVFVKDYIKSWRVIADLSQRHVALLNVMLTAAC